jgi:hypothetical protein
VETIYEAVYRGLVMLIDRQTLRTGRTYRHKRGRGRTRDGALKQSTKMKSIHNRPVVVESGTQIGHWEGDLILGCGRDAAIATLVERKARHTILVPIRGSWTASRVGDALIAVLNTLPPALRRTLTWDQGNELFHHERIERTTGTKIYFADAHSPWQRGTNENTNGLLRQYFPKGSDLSTISDEHLRKVADELNDRPRECLKTALHTKSWHGGVVNSLPADSQRSLESARLTPRCSSMRLWTRSATARSPTAPFYAAIGVTLDGDRDSLGLWAGSGGEGAKFWMSVLTDLRNRGDKDTFFVVCDGLKGLPEVVSNVWPQAVVQTSSSI